MTTHCKSGAAGCSGASTVADCNVCNQGTNDTGGSVAGVVNVHPVTWSPGTIPFPSLNYSSVYLTPTGGAQQQQGGTSCSTSTHNPNTGATCHVFPTTDGKDLLTYIANKNNRRPPSANGRSPTPKELLAAKKLADALGGVEKAKEILALLSKLVQ